MNKEISVYASDAKEQLRRWDAGEIIWSLEMGGLGPGYEQAIQVLAIEIVRDNLGKKIPEKPAKDWGANTLTRIDKSCGGFSGAQFSVAQFLAYQWLTIGPMKLLGSRNTRDRQIQVSNFWPRVL